MVLCSATYPEKTMKFAKGFAAPNPNVISLEVNEVAAKHIKHYQVECGGFEAKYDALHNIYEAFADEVGSWIIFCKTVVTVNKLVTQLQREDHEVDGLHSKLDDEMKQEVFNKFRKGEIKCLVCTDILARGIDIESINLVVNFDLPVSIWPLRVVSQQYFFTLFKLRIAAMEGRTGSLPFLLVKPGT